MEITRRLMLLETAGAVATAGALSTVLAQPAHKERISLSPAIANECSRTARELTAAFQGGNITQRHLQAFLSAHRIGIAHLKESGALLEAEQIAKTNQGRQLIKEQALQAQRIYQAYSGGTVDLAQLMIPLESQVILAAGLDVTAYQLLNELEKRLTHRITPIQADASQWQFCQIVVAMRLVGAFWALGGLAGCFPCAVGGGILGIGGMFLGWAFC